MRRIGGAMLAAFLLAGCGGGGPDEAVEPVPVREPLVDRVLSLTVSPTPGGAIVSAIGLPPRQGFWDAKLVSVPSGDPSLLLLEFRLLPPPEPEPVGTPRSREVVVGRVVTDGALAGIRTIAVRGERNEARSRR